MVHLSASVSPATVTLDQTCEARVLHLVRITEDELKGNFPSIGYFTIRDQHFDTVLGVAEYLDGSCR